MICHPLTKICLLLALNRRLNDSVYLETLIQGILILLIFTFGKSLSKLFFTNKHKAPKNITNFCDISQMIAGATA